MEELLKKTESLFNELHDVYAEQKKFTVVAELREAMSKLDDVCRHVSYAGMIMQRDRAKNESVGMMQAPESGSRGRW